MTLRRMAEGETRALLEELPRELADKAGGIIVTCQDRPSAAMIRDGVEPDLLGLYVGEGLTEAFDNPLPPEILLFLENIWDFADCNPEEYKAEVRKTLMHELGHFLGLDEDDLERRDLD